MRASHVAVGLMVLAVTVEACGTDHSVVSGPPSQPLPPPPPPADTVFDLRFKGVGVLLGREGAIGTFLPGGYLLGFPDASGAPLGIGEGLCAPPLPEDLVNCYWPVRTYVVPPHVDSVSAVYVSDVLTNLPGYLHTGVALDTVITGLDVEPADSGFGISEAVSAPTRGGYVLSEATVAPAALQATATQEGANGRVITAVSFLAGQVMYVSYALNGDSSTYDASVMTAPLLMVGSAVTSLAAGGYIITAFGGDSADGYVVVGTRVHGVTAARSVQINPPPADTGLVGYAPVAVFFNENTPTAYTTVIYEH